jgi:hypothetical protein
MKQTRIVSAAIRHNGFVIPSAHHFDAYMNKLIEVLPPEFHPTCVDWQEGFVTNHGGFVTREQAWRIAFKAGQIIGVEMGYTSGILHSHNLY